MNPHWSEDEDARQREIRRLQKRTNDVHRWFKASENAMPKPPYRTRQQIRDYDLWLSCRNNLRERYVALHRELADRMLPLQSRGTEQDLTLFDAHLLPPFENVPSKARFARQFFDNPEETGRMVRNLLLYDRIYIPTVDLIAIPMLYTMLGDHLVEALSERQIVLVRYKGAVGYIGNGNGLNLFEIWSNERHRLETECDRTGAPTDEVLNHLRNTFLSGDTFSETWPSVYKAVLDNIVEIDSSEFTPVSEATYHEVVGYDLMQQLFGVTNGKLNDLPGVTATQVRWLGPERVNDEIDWLLHLAQFNFESYMADKVGALDQTGGAGTRRVLAARASRVMRAVQADDAFARILRFDRLPDLSSLHMNDEGMAALWKMRQSSESRQFRRWFHENVRDYPGEAERLFHESTRQLGLGDQPAVKATRFFAFSALPDVAVPIANYFLGTNASVPPGVGLGLGLLDTLVVGRFLRPKGPKVMLDRLRGILPSPIRQ